MTGSQRSGYLEPVRRLPELDGFVGLWVAVKEGQVIAADHNPRGLVAQVYAMGSRGRGAVAQYVPEPTDEIVVGVG